MFALFSLVIALRLALSGASAGDPCAAIAGKKWVSPQQARSCLGSFSVDKDIKDNVNMPTFASA
jgi:dolichol kinase